jgi:putative glutamine amidotransferase
MRPLIGIPCHPGLRADSARPIYGNNRSYVHAVEHAGGVPVLIPLLGDLSGLNSLLPRLDGLLLSGGIDIQPHHYGEKPHKLLGEVDARLDELELALAQWALREEIPTLGICRGHQMLNVALGGSLFQDIADQYPNSLRHTNWDLPRNTLSHSVQIDAGSRMEQILGTQELWVNSLHHQSVKTLGKGVRASGYAEDGVVEMLEVPEHRFMVGVQCHPEELYKDNPVWLRLFEALVATCTTSIMSMLPEEKAAISLGIGIV